MFKLKTALFIIFILAACSENKEQQKAKNVSNIPVASPPPTIQANVNLYSPSENEPTIQLENSVCFGGCRKYKVSIYSDGKVVYEGIEGVEKLGIVKSRITKSQLEELIRQFEDIDFFRLPDKYIPGKKCPGSVVSDASTIQIYYNDGKLSKNISHYRGCRGTEDLNKLLMLELNIEKVVNTKQWID